MTETIFTQIKNYFKNKQNEKILKKLGLPKVIDDLWLAYIIPAKEKVEGKKFLLKKYPYYDEVVQLFKVGKIKVFYKLISIGYPSGFADLAYWDNGKKYTFEFDHIEVLTSPNQA